MSSIEELEASIDIVELVKRYANLKKKLEQITKLYAHFLDTMKKLHLLLLARQNN